MGSKAESVSSRSFFELSQMNGMKKMCSDTNPTICVVPREATLLAFRYRRGNEV